MVWNRDNNSKKSFYRKTERLSTNQKRGKLSQLMKEEDKQKAGIHEPSYICN